MTDPKNLPATISDALSSVPAALVPSSVKALDRLIGAAISVPEAWLLQQKAKIDAQTEAYKLVENRIAQSAAVAAGLDANVVERAKEVLIRKEYRKQLNRDAVAAVMIKEIAGASAVAGNLAEAAPDAAAKGLDDDWLNAFEKFAEDASSERLQSLWGRVLAGEIRRPGRFSMRTLRSLSEFSQREAEAFEALAKVSFADIAPRSLGISKGDKNFADLLLLQSSGVVEGVDGLGLDNTLTFRPDGLSFIREDDVCIVAKGVPGASTKMSVIYLSPIAQEVRSLIVGRSAFDAAEKVAIAMRTPDVMECAIAKVTSDLSSGAFEYKINKKLW